ncbi:MAG: ssk1 response regulator receiver [Cirrosporium novae-zelandiae]|nr:MAG: ssk1 response regulator receiver [Cirrosporium novae-zelandiae]
MAQDIPVAANVLGTIGTICWCVQLIPQIWTNWRTKETEGLPSLMMFIWAVCGVPFGVYAIVQDLNIPIQIQPQIFGCLTLVSWAQTLKYQGKWSTCKATGIAVLCALLFGGTEALLILTLRGPYHRGITWPITLIGGIAAFLLAIGLLPPYFELAKRRGRVVGINFLFLTVDWSGAFFSLLSLAAQHSFDIMGGILYILCILLELGIFTSQFIWLFRTRGIRKRAKEAGVPFDEFPEAQEFQNKGRKKTMEISGPSSAVDLELGKCDNNEQMQDSDEGGKEKRSALVDIVDLEVTEENVPEKKISPIAFLGGAMGVLQIARAKLLRRSSHYDTSPTPSLLHFKRRHSNHNSSKVDIGVGDSSLVDDGKLPQAETQELDTEESVFPPTDKPATSKSSEINIEDDDSEHSPTSSTPPSPIHSQSPAEPEPVSVPVPVPVLEPAPLIDEGVPDLTVQEPTPAAAALDIEDRPSAELPNIDKGITLPSPITTPKRPTIGFRRQSLVPASQHRLIKTLLAGDREIGSRKTSLDFVGDTTSSLANMINRKIWVKRPGASATLVMINEDDLVDDVRDAILKKYANSLGHNFDAPDLTLRIVPRQTHSNSKSSNGERILGPEEPMTRTLDAYYSGGQTVDEALLIDIPQRRTPRPSPRIQQQMPYYYEESRPGESGDYFPLVPVGGSPHVANLSLPHSMSIVNTGQLPALPSPGGKTSRKQRPQYVRQRTGSPTILSSHPPPNSGLSQQHSSHSSHSRINSFHSDTKSVTGGPPAPPLPTPPAPAEPSPRPVPAPPPVRTSSPRPQRHRSAARRYKKSAETPALPAGLLNGSVPPINVLIVEDNPINLKLLEAFMKRLKVRWQTAMNGREAVKKWRDGGFHLVLMDIQLPIMNGLQATKEIRRLERLNNIGVFSSSASSTAPTGILDGSVPELDEEAVGDDILADLNKFKSPVIIVALTASSLQSDRHEALAAGCNDFLTKPVNFPWLERKVMEWGCMQALIDFDGWRKWKDFSTPATGSIKDGSSTAKPKSKLSNTTKPEKGEATNGVGAAGPSNGDKKRPKPRWENLSLSSRSGSGSDGMNEAGSGST